MWLDGESLVNVVRESQPSIWGKISYLMGGVAAQWTGFFCHCLINRIRHPQPSDGHRWRASWLSHGHSTKRPDDSRSGYFLQRLSCFWVLLFFPFCTICLIMERRHFKKQRCFWMCLLVTGFSLTCRASRKALFSGVAQTLLWRSRLSSTVLPSREGCSICLSGLGLLREFVFVSYLAWLLLLIPFQNLSATNY